MPPCRVGGTNSVSSRFTVPPGSCSSKSKSFSGFGFALRIVAPFRFIAAQTPLGDALYRHYGLDTRDYETNMLLAHGRAYFKSDGTIRMLTGLGLPWSMAGILRLIPGALRDAIYGFVARRRLLIAGRRDSCYLPTAEERGRFLS